MRNFLRDGLKKLVGADSGRPQGTRRAIVLAVAAQKGGVGKTTTCVSLGAALARFHDRRVLIVDLDPQGHVHRALHAVVRPGGRPLSQILRDEPPGDLMDAVTTTTVSGLDITAADHKLSEIDGILASRIGKEMVLRDALRAARTWYDVIILDCPPNAGTLATNALVACDRVLIPCESAPLAVQGVEAIVQTIATVASRLNPNIDVAGVLVTRYDGRNAALNQKVDAELHDTCGDALLDVRIGVNATLTRAQAEGRDIFDFAPTSRGADDYRALAELLVPQLVAP